VTDGQAEEEVGGAMPPAADVRQKAIDVLCEAFAQDQLTVEDFEDRVALAHQVTSVGELRKLLQGLDALESLVPAKRGQSLDPTLPQRVPQPTVLPARVTISPDNLTEHSVMMGILGGGGRSGTWVPARINWAVGVMGGCELDFREARLGPGVTEVRVLALWGGVEVIVPPDVQVECSAIGILGGFEQVGTVASTTDPDAPVIRITGVAIMGGGSVTVRYPGETGRDARRRLKAEKRAMKQLRSGR
jgi:hypothetical protein